jgi:predicted transcriptional regulator
MIEGLLNLVALVQPSAWLDALVTSISILFAILAAVWISPSIAMRHARRNNQENVLRRLINSRLIVANPEWQTALALVPMEFQSSKVVLASRRRYHEHVSTLLDGKNDNEKSTHIAETSNLQNKLIADIAKYLKIEGLDPESLNRDRYLSQAFADREVLILKALAALPDISDALTSLSAQHNRLVLHQLASGQIWPIPQDLDDEAEPKQPE